MVKLLPEYAHSLLRFLSHFLGVLQLVLQQLFELLVLLLDLLVLGRLLEKGVDAAGLNGGVVLVPIVVPQLALQNQQLLPLLLVVFKYFGEFRVAKGCRRTGVTHVEEFDCEFVVADVVNLVLIGGEVEYFVELGLLRGEGGTSRWLE
jgi:hypothetical protein